MRTCRKAGRLLAAVAMAGAAVALWGGSAARAAESPMGGEGASGGAATEASRLEPVVVTATRVEQPVSQVGSAVTVIGGDDLRRRGIEFVSDALQEVPGLTVPRSGTTGKATSLFMRGANANQTLVLIDGVRANAPVGGGFDFSQLTTDNIERIEVIRGPQSTLYGSDAIGGVVNIITRRGRGPISATVSGRAGNHDTYDIAGGIRGGADRLGGTLEASRFKTDNRFPNDGVRIDTLSARVDTRPLDRLSATATFRRADTDGGAPGQVFINLRPEDRQANRFDAIGVELEHRTTAIWSQRLALKYSDQRLDFRAPAFTSKAQSSTRAVEWVHTVEPAPPLSLVVGGEYRQERGHSDDTLGTRFDNDFHTRALFVQAQVSGFGERLFLQGGMRVDDGTRIDGVVSPKVAAAWLVPETGTRLHASWGKGIRRPTFVDLFFPGFSNPNLVPERATGWDAGVDQQLAGRRVEAGLTFFRNDFEQLIVLDPFFVPMNVGRAHSYGVESTLAVRPADWIDGGFAYTFLRAVNDETGADLVRRPRHQGSAKVTVRPVPRGSVTLAGLLVGDRADFVGFGGPQVRGGGYFRLDASALYGLPRVPGLRSLELLARVENLLDRRYEEVAGFPALGTSVLAGVRGTF